MLQQVNSVRCGRAGRKVVELCAPGDVRAKKEKGIRCSSCGRRVKKLPCRWCSVALAAREFQAAGGFEDEPALELDAEAQARYEEIRKRSPEKNDVRT